MRQFAQPMQIRGIITLKLRDANTLELLEERVIENNVTNLAEKRFMSIRSWLTGEGGGGIHNDISISEDSVLSIPSCHIFPRAAVANVINRDTNITGTGNPFLPPWSQPLDDGPPVFFSTEQRFNAPASNRTIRTIMLGQGQVSFTSMYAYAEVNPPCVQTTTQVLDITYRVQWFFQPGSAESTSVATLYGREFANKWAVNIGSNAGAHPESAIRFWTGKIPPSPDISERWPTTLNAGNNLGITEGNQSVRNPSLGSTSTSTYTGDSGGPLAHYRIDHEIDKVFADNVGQIYGSIGYGVAGTGNQLTAKGLTVLAPFAPSGFANKPVQPIHNHSSDAIEPFLDVDFLATSQGDITVDGSSWTDTDYPEFYRVDIYGAAGAVGAGPTYAIRKRNTFGFEESTVNGEGTYKTQQDPIPFLYDSMHSNIAPPATPLDDKTSIIGSHGIKNQRYREEYDLTKTVTFDKMGIFNSLPANVVDNGISIVDLVDGTFVNFDPTTTPALGAGAGSIVQTAVDDSGNVYVADRDRGLFKITDPFGAPSITHFTFAVHVIPSVLSDTACYGVAIGNGGSVWAMFEDGLSETTDGGTSWTNYDPAAGSFVTEDFEFAGITDGNWGNVHFIRANRDAADPNNEIGIAKTQPSAGTPANESDIVWWTKASGGTTSAGPSAADGFNNVNTTSFKCSRRGGVWAFTDVNFSGGGTNTQTRLSTVVFGSSSRTLVTISQTGQGDMTGVNFFYDAFGAPHVLAGGDGSPALEGIFALDGPTKIANLTFAGNQLGGIYYAPEGDPRGVCTGIANLPSSARDNTPAPDLIATVSPDTSANSHMAGGNLALSALNLEDSALQEMVWSSYNWDGGSFTEGYHVAAVDTAPGFGSGFPPFPGDRKNFHTEDQTFTGRSLIDVSAIFTGPTWAPGPSDATFTFYVTPADKLDTVSGNAEQRQEDERILLSIEDPAIPGSTFRVWWEDTGGTIAIENTTGSIVSTGTPTPADGVPYRLVVVVDQSATSGLGPAVPSIYVSLDGVLLGPPIPVPFPFDWSGPSPIGYLGSRVFPPWQVPVTTPHPYFFYRGLMENVQYWNVPFDGPAIADDFFGLGGTGVTAFVPPGPAVTNLIAVHDNTAVLTGLETKATHFSSDALINGLLIDFDNGGGGDSFVPTDYFTFGVCDGVMKDNAIEMSQQFSVYTKPVDLAFTTFENAGGAATVPPGTATVTEPIQWQERSLVNASGDRGVLNTTTDAIRPGEYVKGAVTGGTSAITGAVSHQGLTGDGEAQWTMFHALQANLHVGLTSNPTFGGGSESHSFAVASNMEMSARFKVDGDVDTYLGGVLDTAAVTTYVTGDEFRFVRVGTTISLVKVTGGPATVHTYAPALAGTIGVRVNSTSGFSNGITDATITYTLPALFMTIGHADGVPALRTGKFNPDYLRCETDILDSISIEADAVPLTVTKSETFFTSMIAPGPGEVIINGEAGWLKFNAAESGKTITGSLTVIYDKI